MKKLFVVCGLILLTATCGLGAPSRRIPAPGILGIRLGMTEDAARRQLNKLGRQQKEDKKEEEEEGGEEEVWSLARDRHFASLLVGFDKMHRVRYITLIAREHADRMLYSTVGDLTTAKRETVANNYRYTWDIPATSRQPRYLVILRGNDAQYLSSYSIKKVE